MHHSFADNIARRKQQQPYDTHRKDSANSTICTREEVKIIFEKLKIIFERLKITRPYDGALHDVSSVSAAP